jgi:hypothetical protein
MTVFTLSWATSVGWVIQVFYAVVSVLFFVSICADCNREKCLFHNGHRFFLVLPFLFLEFRQSSSGDFVLMYRNGFDGVYLWSFGNFLVGIVSYEHSLFWELLWHLIWLESSEQLLRL